jgi:anthranilate/para-aminobenzoate synthase component II
VLLVIDNFDSFTYNLVQYFGQLGVEQRVFRNNEITAERRWRSIPTASCSPPDPARRTTPG